MTDEEIKGLTEEEIKRICAIHGLTKPKIKPPREFVNGTGYYVYHLYEGDVLRYVGKTTNIEHRIEQHFYPYMVKKEQWKTGVTKCIVKEYATKQDMNLQETYDIKTMSPTENKQVNGIAKNTIPIKEYEYEGTLQSSEVKIEHVLKAIEEALEDISSPINLRELIRNKLYSPETSNNTITSWTKRKEYRNQIVDLVKEYNYKLVSKKGRFGGLFIECA